MSADDSGLSGSGVVVTIHEGGDQYVVVKPRCIPYTLKMNCKSNSQAISLL